MLRILWVAFSGWLETVFVLCLYCSNRLIHLKGGWFVSDDYRDLVIRAYEQSDEAGVVELWRDCGLIVPWNDPYEDIKAKIDFQPSLFFIGKIDERIVAAVMAGYDGHRGWIYYLGVAPDYQRRGLGGRIVAFAEEKLKELGCLKINLQVRRTNKKVIDFYQSIGFSEDDVLSLGKRLA